MREALYRCVRFIFADARHYQVLCLACLVAVGLVYFDIEIRGANALVMVLTALATQYAFTRLLRLPNFDPRSPFISSMSLSLLLQTTSLGIAAVAAFLAIASKFVIRWRGKHVFNPTNIAIVILVLLVDNAWVSSSQWGTAVWVAFLIACLGGLVVNTVGRSDISFAVLIFYGGLLFGRALWLGDPLSIPMHQIQSGALLIFAFFMISDPKTTPDSRMGRVIFALLVVAFAGWVQFGLFRPNGLLYALAVMAPATPIIDWFMPSRRFEWKQTRGFRLPAQKGENNEYETNSCVGGVHLPESAG